MTSIAAKVAWAAALLLSLPIVSATAQQSGIASPEELPKSPNGLPMESAWTRAPEAPDGRLQTTGPYYASRWGGIVIRGRREGDRVITALSIIHCGTGDDPATDVTLIGEPPKGLCDNVKKLSPGKEVSVGGQGYGGAYELYGTSKGWTVINFSQTIGNLDFSGGLEPATEKTNKRFGITGLGAVYRDEGGKHVFYAPGETVQLGGNVSLVVKPVMDAEELQTIAIAAAMRSFSEIKIGEQKDKAPADKVAAQKDNAHSEKGGPPTQKPPPWFMILFFGTPLVAIGVVVYLVTRLLRRRRTGALPPINK